MFGAYAKEGIKYKSEKIKAKKKNEKKNEKRNKNVGFRRLGGGIA